MLNLSRSILQFPLKKQPFLSSNLDVLNNPENIGMELIQKFLIHFLNDIVFCLGVLWSPSTKL